jgi:ABC-type multidrug transport system permease subunit
MTSKLLLRVAAVLIFIHCFLHTIGFTSWKQPADPLEGQIVQQMTGHKFPFMGASHSLADYYDGFGYASSIALFLIAAILFIIAADLSSNAALAKKIIITLGIGLLFWGIDELIFFFPFAAVITLTACACTFASLYLMGKQKKAT